MLKCERSTFSGDTYLYYSLHFLINVFTFRTYPQPTPDNIADGYTIVVSLINTCQEGLKRTDDNVLKLEEFFLIR
jgi:hypothetical protein